MMTKRPTLEQALYALALLLAAMTRLTALSRFTLNDAEAALGLQALALARDGAAVTLPHPLYLLLTGSLVYFFDASAFVARLLPALAGILLVFWPFLLRDVLGQRAALVLAFLIALDPGLLGTSVQAGSGLIAPACLLFALAAWIRRKPVGAGIFAGWSLLGGPGIWPGLLGLGLAAWFSYRKAGLGRQESAFDWRTAGLAGAASLGLTGTLLFFAPSGISAAATSFTTFLSGWAQSSGVSLLRMFAALGVYEALVLLLGLSRLIRGVFIDRDGLDLFLAVWWLAALLLALIYPARQVIDLVWSIIPLLILAARQVDRMLVVDREHRLTTLGQAGLVLFLSLLLVNLLISWPNQNLGTAGQVYRWAVLGLAILLIVSESVLVAWGWGRRVAFSGLMWGVAALLGIYSISAGVNAAGLAGRERNTAELWRSAPAFTDADLLLRTLKDYSQWVPSLNKAPEIVVAGIDSAAVRWILRDKSDVNVVSALSPEARADFLVTQSLREITQSAGYSGQEFTLAEAPAWELISPGEWVRWIFFRQLPADAWTRTSLILWVRVDRFPGSEGVNEPSITP